MCSNVKMKIDDVSKENNMNLHNSVPDFTANTHSPNAENTILDRVVVHQCNKANNEEYPDQDETSNKNQVDHSSYSKTTEPILCVNINTNKVSDERDLHANLLDNSTTHEDDKEPVSLSSKSRSRIILEDSDSEAEIDKDPEHDNTSTEVESTSMSQKSQKHKRIAILDSDSEPELKNDDRQLDTLTNVAEVLNLLEKGQKHKRIAILDSDSEPESNNELEHTEEQNNTPTFAATEISSFVRNGKHKRIAGIEIDSSDEEGNADFITPHNKSLDDNISTNKKDNVDSAIVYTTNSKGEIVPEGEQNKQLSRLAMLCDSDSEEDLDSAKQNKLDVDLSDYNVTEQTQQQERSKSRIKKPVKSKPKKSNAKDVEDIPKKMTAKEAAEQRQEIQSESQRMLREKNISLPYHKPKSHSLKEFLARRPTLSRAMPVVGRAPASVAIKMTTEQLELISKKLKEREKEVKEFYKSESESDDDGSDNEYIPPIDDQKQSEKTSNENTKDNLTPNIELDAPCNTSKTTNKELSLDNASNSIKDSLCSNDDHIEKEPQCDIPSVNVVESINVDSVTLERSCEQGSENGEKEIMPAEGEPNTESPMDFDDVPQTNTTEESTNSNLNEELFELPFRSSTVLTCDNLTESYDFHLEDENTERDVSTDSIEKTMDNSDESVTKQKTVPPEFSYTDLDREIESYGNPQAEIPQDEPSLPNFKSKLELLKEQLAHDKPTLSGKPNDVIDLDYGVTKPREVVQLMERFAKHVFAKKHQPKHKVKLSIVTVESGGDIRQEEVAMNVNSDEETAGSDEKPGAKLQKLRGELQKQMEQKKTELWQQKAAKGFRVGLENHENAKGDEKDVLDCDEEEEAEMTDEEEIEEEEIVDDIEITDKPREKSAFLDEEAEVTDEEEYDTSPKEGYENQIEDPGEGREVENVDNDSDNDGDEIREDDDSNMSGESRTTEQPTKKSVLRRIIKPADDSDEEDLFNDSAINKSSNNIHLDSTVTADEEEIPPHQPRQLHTPIRPAVSQTKSISDFLTPISFITSIQNLTSAAKSTKSGPVVSPFRIPENLQSPGKEFKVMTQKKLFTGSEVLESQGSFDISCSQENGVEAACTEEPLSVSNEIVPSTQDLLGICSGQFTGLTQLDPTENTNQLTDFGSSQSSDLKSLGQEDMIISQLLDEEELENFKKKFESPINPVSQRRSIFEAEEVTGGGIIDSDEDEDDDDTEQQKKKKKNQIRIQFSDDGSSDEEVEDDNEQINLEDKEEIDEDDVAYDSEENEIDLNEQGKRENIKMADFLEAEAELSESEWGSEDEDENDLDKLEFELGDTDKFDEEKVKSDLEKIHMRRMLDDDTREVKLLQELLLEDGEMHGTGRQRQFKWKNMDLNTEQAEEKKDDDDEIYIDEEESEEQWRKKRHEREMFLKQQKSRDVNPEEDLLCTSQLLKIGQQFLKRSISHSSQNSTTSEKSNTESGIPFNNTLFGIQNKRGSFLNRNDQVLQRVAEYTKVTAGVDVNSKRTTKHFLFQSVSATEVSISSENGNKRKALDGTPNVLKKLRLSTNFSPVVKKNREKSERSKKLFNF